MALTALLFSLFVLLQQVNGSIDLHILQSENVPTLHCNQLSDDEDTGALCWISDLSSEFQEMTCSKTMDNNGDYEENRHKKSKQHHRQCTTTKDEKESNSLTFNVKPDNSTVFTCTVLNSTGGASSICPSWITLTGPRCEDYHLNLVVKLNETDEIFSTDESPSSLTAPKGHNVTLPCQFELDNALPFTLLWFTSGNINKCLSSVHIEGYEFHFNTRCCVDGKSAQRIFNHSSSNPTGKIQFHNLTIQSVEVMDTGRYLCVIHGVTKGKPIWKIAANISLTVTESSVESTHSPTSTSGISQGTSDGTPTNRKQPIITIVAVVCVVIPICIVGVYLIRRKQQMAKGVAYAVVPRRENSDENEIVAYAVTEVPAPPSQSKPDKGKEKIHTTSASTEHVYCLIKEPAVKGARDKTEIQEVESKDDRNHGASAPIELNNWSLLNQGDPMALPTDPTYSLIGSPGEESLRHPVPQSDMKANDPNHGLLKMEENPIYSK
ncbi:uncharacterized protein LOC132834692 [Hemiscyllium ocellatum]|uniref:uncharacterized protein LOC132834692 n=1 Tax=Hemiscyllium ocellatum TaxID=170820 RepID=UPI002966A3C6|nr:uncharacterized protein LOC132834692 [Hemiscyllium ocellatum]